MNCRNIFIIALCALIGSVACSSNYSSNGPGNYAKSPRFNALLYYSDSAETAHVQFGEQTAAFFKSLTVGEGFYLDVTTDFTRYTYDDLKKYDVIIMANASPQTPAERDAFEKYIKNGGGWVGFHAAAYNDSRTDWPWFNEFLGCGHFLCNNWPPQPALLDVNVKRHPVTKNIPSSFVAPSSEWYMWEKSPRLNRDVEVLLSLSPKNYPIGIKDVVSYGDFPVVWTNKKYRMIYLNMGHGDVEYIDGVQNLLFINAFRWIVSRAPSGDPFKVR
ncbi:MAG: ThuA domain-containing protein [Candidatus Cryptobacteroides sp.]